MSERNEDRDLINQEVNDRSQGSKNETLSIPVRELRKLLGMAKESPFLLGKGFTPDNIVEIAKSQFPRLEAKVAMHREAERTRRVLIVLTAVCVIAGAALVVFAPTGKEGVSYVVATALCVLSLGAIGVQEFRIRTIGVRVEGGKKSVGKEQSE